MRRAALATITAVTLLPFAAVAPSVAAGGPVPIATHLNNPRQLAFDPAGNLYVAEAGRGAVGATITGTCLPGPEGGPVCPGNTSSVTVIAHPGSAAADSGRRIRKGLLSVASPKGQFAVGLDSISFAPDGTPYGIVTYYPPSALPQSLAWQAGQLITDEGGRLVPLANIGAYSLARPNPGHEADSDPYSVLAGSKAEYVADAGNNTLLKVVGGRISTLHVFRYRHGSTGFDTVPNSLAWGPNHLLYVGDLASFIPGAARVAVIDPSTGNVVRTISGLTTVTAVAVGKDGTVYASEMFAGCAPDDSTCTPGRIAVIHPDGSRYEIPAPLTGGVAVDAHGHIYASVFSVLPGAGAVWRLS